MRRIVILAIGNELLLGETLDTNSNWLCRHLTGLGGQVVSVIILPDIIAPIAEAVARVCREARELIDLLITVGGLGPTDDDLTLAAVAQALDSPLARNQTAYHWVVEKYAELARQGYVNSPEMNDARIKMAMLPAGAIPLKNPVGAAPAIKVSCGDTTIICLPGVPDEMKAIVKDSLAATLTDLFGVGGFEERDLLVACGDESALAPILRAVVAAHPNVYIKSKAKTFAANQCFKIKLHARGDAAMIKELLDRAETDLTSALVAAGIARLPQE